MELKFSLYKLRFTSPLHIGDVRADYGVSHHTISSDSMYAALIATLAKIGEDIPKYGDLGCTISSLFPFCGNTLFFPRPLNLQVSVLDDARLAKTFKKITWLNTNDFLKALNGALTLSDSDKDRIYEGFLFEDSKNTPKKDFITSQITERVCVKSRTGESNTTPFYMDRVCFDENSGLFFIADGNTSHIDKALKLLKHEGLGTDRNVGNGNFEYSQDNLSWHLPDNANKIISLSSFIPTDKEQLATLLCGNDIAYDFERRGGWITTSPYNHIRKNVIYVFKAGSVFNKPQSAETIEGKIVNLKPNLPGNMKKIDHEIYRCGKAIMLPIA